MDQICEGIQRRKFHTLINTLTVTLMNAVLCNKMELGGFSVESQMECFIKDVKAFLELSDRSTQEKDFTRFSKIELPTKRRKLRSLQSYKHSSWCSRRIGRRPTSNLHDYALFIL